MDWFLYDIGLRHERVNFTEFTVGYFNEYEGFGDSKQIWWNYKTFISMTFTVLKLIN